MRRVLIVGKNSYIGKKFIELVEESEDIVCDEIDSVDDLWKQTDFGSYHTVFHVAGIAHISMDPKMKELYYRVNRDLAINVAEHAKNCGTKQFIFMSSMIIYGKDGKIGQKKSIVRGDEFDPENFYGMSKLEADLSIQKLDDSSFRTVIIRAPVVYGEGCKGNFPRLVRLAQKSLFFPNIKNERSMIYIKNLTEFIRLCVLNDSRGVFFPQNTEYVDTASLISKIREYSGKKTILISIFNPMVRLLSHFSNLVNKVFGNKVYDIKLSNTFDNRYNIVSFDQSIREYLNKNGANYE